jgi:hypothetical protein
MGGILILIIVNIVRDSFFEEIKMGIFFWGVPSSIAIGSIVSQGIELFSGDIPDLSWNNSQLVILISLLISFFVFPTLFFVNWRRFQLADNTLRESTHIRKTVIWLTIGAMCVPLFCLTPPIEYVRLQVGQSVHRGAARDVNRDALVNDLVDVGMQAQAFYYIPTELGGGGKHWKNIQQSDGTVRDFSLNDVHYTRPVTAKIFEDFYPQSPNKFILESVSDTMLSIVGIGNEIGNDEKFQNKDGRVGYVQATTTVTPHSTRTGVNN